MSEIERLRQALVGALVAANRVLPSNDEPAWVTTARAALASTPPVAERGEWQTVPVEPATLMNVEGHRALEAVLGHPVHVPAIPSIYRAMLKAAPPSPRTPEGQ